MKNGKVIRVELVPHAKVKAIAEIYDLISGSAFNFQIDTVPINRDVIAGSEPDLFIVQQQNRRDQSRIENVLCSTIVAENITSSNIGSNPELPSVACIFWTRPDDATQ